MSSEAIEALEQLAVHYLGPVKTLDKLAFMKHIASVCEEEERRYFGNQPESPF